MLVCSYTYDLVVCYKQLYIEKEMGFKFIFIHNFLNIANCDVFSTCLH